MLSRGVCLFLVILSKFPFQTSKSPFKKQTFLFEISRSFRSEKKRSTENDPEISDRKNRWPTDKEPVDIELFLP